MGYSSDDQISCREFVAQLDERIGGLNRSAASVETRLKEVQQARQQFTETADNYKSQLALALLSSPSVNHLLALEPLAGMRAAILSLQNARKQEERDLPAEIRRIETTPDYVNRQPLLEQLEAELFAKNEDRNNLNHGLERYTSIDGFTDLIHKNYHTREYLYSWLNAQYYRDWKRADEIVEELNARHWNDLAQNYQELKEALAYQDELTSQLQKRIREIKDFEANLESLQERLQKLPEKYRDLAQIEITSRLDDDTLRLLYVRGNTPEIRASAQSALNAIAQSQQQEPVEAELQEQLNKVNGQLTTLSVIRTQATHRPERTIPRRDSVLIVERPDYYESVWHTHYSSWGGLSSSYSDSSWSGDSSRDYDRHGYVS